MRSNRCNMYQTEKKAILLATYNGEKYIPEQIESILGQTNRDWMLYIHDDGSKDHTWEIIRNYERKFPEQIIVVESAPTGGAKNNFFYLFEQVEAPYYLCCDQDDVWLPEKIEKTIEKMKTVETESNVPCMVFTELMVVDENLTVVANKMSKYQGLDCETVNFNRLLIQNVVTGCTMMVNRALRDELIKINDYTNVLMHDWWAALVAARLGKLEFIKEPTILYRQHGKNSVGAQNANTPGYMFKRMLQGTAIKESLENTRKQAALFGEIYEKEQPGIACAYASVKELGKGKRLDFYRKNNIRKSTFAKNLGLFIWG